jgi:hypothetical protein
MKELEMHIIGYAKELGMMIWKSDLKLEGKNFMKDILSLKIRFYKDYREHLWAPFGVICISYNSC